MMLCLYISILNIFNYILNGRSNYIFIILVIKGSVKYVGVW